ncbi:MAG: PAS domain-containing protein [Desulfobulbus sp.]|uniref:PAS domain-containing protein n=1 Tax=Desulfobulbus sp. TaxID=895 RepID=UPI00284D5976|nr:PAS domain-containing protein [Desulfobulbus sp.]MDR2551001.1 PAS domain-containing protein [Desulfobulbus sp.]
MQEEKNIPQEDERSLDDLFESSERARLMLDASPLVCGFWNERLETIDCNLEALRLFGLASKQEYLDHFIELSPKYQPDGTLSSDNALKKIQQAFETGYQRFEWVHRTSGGELIPAEITLVRIKHDHKHIVVSYIRDLRELKASLAAMQEANERTQLMLDATPLCCTIWDERCQPIDCNLEAVRLFGLASKQEYLERFDELSPEYQPGGQRSREHSVENIKLAFETGSIKLEWMHRKVDGEPIPAEVVLVRIKHGDRYIVVSYTRDLRELKASLTAMSEADERTQIMLDATPLCCNIWDDQFDNIDCNLEAARLFDLGSKQEYLERFWELSPEYQPNDRLSAEYAAEKLRLAFETGFQKYEWMHRKLNGEPIPAEITLVRVKHGSRYIVAGYTRDLRELKTTLAAMQEANERTQIMLDATPLCCNFWDENYNNIDCNLEAARLFGLSGKQEYLDRFMELSPEYQPNGRLSAELAVEKINLAFETGVQRFEWMHRKLDGEPVPSEITLVRVKHGDRYIVAGYTRDLRELKATFAAMQEANERTQLMLDATPLCCMIWDEQYQPIDCNLEAVRLFDLGSKQEYLDRFIELSPEHQPDGQRSADRIVPNTKQAFETGVCKLEWMHRKLNGELIPSEVILVRVKHGDRYVVVSYTRDLRELKASLAAMREADERTQIMLDATPLCCNIWDDQLNNIDCNLEAARLFELNGKQEYLERFMELSPEYQPNGRLSAELAVEKIHLAFASGLQRFEWMHQKLNGEPVPSEITLVRVKHGDRYIVAGYTRDLRELKATLAEMRKAEEELRLARDLAEESARAKSEFLANMSHEIRTPMNAILGMTYLLLQTEMTAKQRDYLNKTEQSANLLLRIINDILDFSKIEAGRLEMEKISFSLETVVVDVADIVREQLIDKKLEIYLDIEHTIPSALVGDPLRLKQVLLNLMNNAIKFTHKGALYLTVHEQKRGADKAVLNFSVRDTGIGMSPQQKARLFVPFTQADTSTTRKYGGTGLGLAICKSLVELMNGTIWCESELDVGTTFHFSVEFGLSATGEPALPLTMLDRLHVLLSGDNDDWLATAGDKLRALQCAHIDTALGMQALDAYLATDAARQVQLVIMDWQDMEQAVPLAVARLEAHYRQAAPVVLYALFSHNDDILKDVAYDGQTGILRKPITTLSLHRAVVDLLYPSKETAAELERQPPGQESDPYSSLQGLRVLLAEDNEFNKLIAVEMLQAKGVVVDVASTGREALAQLRQSSFDLVLMDIQMPDMDGLTATREIRSDERYKDLPVLAMTAHAMSGDRELSLANKMNDHITKPIHADELYAALKKWDPRT